MRHPYAATLPVWTPAACASVLAAGVVLFAGRIAPAATDADCLECHEDNSLEASDGRKVGVTPATLAAGAHAKVSCTQCHDQPGDYESTPHFGAYRRVRCERCHSAASASFGGSFHGVARERGEAKAPTCTSCHQTGADAHAIQPLTRRTAEASCRACHPREATEFDGSVHAAAAREGKASPGCPTCHPTHGATLPPSAGAISKVCDDCHPAAMESMAESKHGELAADARGQLSCAACHEVHATRRPHLDDGTLKACVGCHRDVRQAFAGSVHERSFAEGKMSCLTCHTTHQVADAPEREGVGCGACHTQEESEYRKSAHRQARLRGDKVAATCGDCHGGHHIITANDFTSPVHRCEEPNTCGKCHGNRGGMVTADYVRLPISLPRYVESVHGMNWQACMQTAVCSDCHGTHALMTGSDPESTIHKQNLAETCGRCHPVPSAEYSASVHGRAVTHGIDDSPSCTDCHDEHSILPHDDPRSPVHKEKLAHDVCAKCHQDPEMAARYGLPPEVIESYADSYHGWATRRGGKQVAVCVDCHNTHAIGSVLDPKSSIHKNNVVATCTKCHRGANAEFAASYTHVLARGKRMIHDWVQLAYVVLLVLVLGGMAVHNLIILVFDLRRHRRHQRGEPAVRRMTAAELVQHFVLLITFTGLALSGFALRFPDAFWVRALAACGFNEELRRLFHRSMAILLVAGSLWHLYYLLLTRRGRRLGWAMLPRLVDVKDALANMAYYLRLRPQKPTFGVFDYTQKAEYWALIWGTVVMSVTGLVLWFPAYVTQWFPAWAVRVSEVIHFYEAILAVSAIIIWHFFFVVFKPGIYPMSWIWLDGRMPMEEYRDHHGRADAELGEPAEVLPGVDDPRG